MSILNIHGNNSTSTYMYLGSTFTDMSIFFKKIISVFYLNRLLQHHLIFLAMPILFQSNPCQKLRLIKFNCSNNWQCTTSFSH